MEMTQKKKCKTSLYASPKCHFKFFSHPCPQLFAAQDLPKMTMDVQNYPNVLPRVYIQPETRKAK